MSDSPGATAEQLDLLALPHQPTPVEIERRRRIRVCLFAYAYEIQDKPVATDAEFDALAAAIDPSIDTGHPVMDAWFQESFAPHTGSWIHCHPELDRLKALYARLYAPTRTTRPMPRRSNGPA